MQGRSKLPSTRTSHRSFGRNVAVAAVLVLILSLPACHRLAPNTSGIMDRSEASAEPVRLVYLGSGGWIFERGTDQLLAAPLFSNPGLLTTGLLGIRSKPAVVDSFMSKYDVADAVAILVGHAHYDHLMDVPRVATTHAPDARIVGSTTVKNTLGTWSGVSHRVDVVNDSAGDQRTEGRWLRYGSGIRIMALRSFHAPHSDGYTLYQGSRARALTEEPALATEWLDGQTHAYLVDFVDPDGSVAFRIYYQDAVAPPPAGFAPESIIAQHAVDVAILVPATFDQVDWHPEAFIENLRPKRVILGHWETFFGPPRSPTVAIEFADIAHFESRLVRVFDGEWWRPDLFAEFLFPSG